METNKFPSVNPLFRQKSAHKIRRGGSQTLPYRSFLFPDGNYLRTALLLQSLRGQVTHLPLPVDLRVRLGPLGGLHILLEDGERLAFEDQPEPPAILGRTGA